MAKFFGMMNYLFPYSDSELIFTSSLGVDSFDNAACC